MARRILPPCSPYTLGPPLPIQCRPHYHHQDELQTRSERAYDVVLGRLCRPQKVELPFCSHPRTLYDIIWGARQQAFGDGRDQRAWSISQLIPACRDQGLRIYGLEETEDYWVVGKKSAGLKGFLPVWERTQPPRLEMVERIREKSLDELEDLMSEFSRDATRDDLPDHVSSVSDHRISVSTARDADTSRQSRSVSSGSVFLPST